tara:strand:+ start:193 stop:321 length:129 start_codon:yes stop_codon:yes gene_type:complete
MKNKKSECCDEQLIKYNRIWDDGICIKCRQHTPAKKEKKEIA